MKEPSHLGIGALSFLRSAELWALFIKFLMHNFQTCNIWKLIIGIWNFLCTEKGSTAYGIRTRVTAVKGRRPKPLDERGIFSNMRNESLT